MVGVNKKPLDRSMEYISTPAIHCRKLNSSSSHTGEEEWPLSSQVKEVLEPEMSGESGLLSGELKASRRNLGFGVCTRQREDSRVSMGSWLESQVKLATFDSVAITC